ncbi:MAG: hypothetical protein MAG451_00341 [Anaerolineales bacterium]|nr:hypothetical protein [Anaerolineales bacterium]
MRRVVLRPAGSCSSGFRLCRRLPLRQLKGRIAVQHEGGPDRVTGPFLVRVLACAPQSLTDSSAGQHLIVKSGSEGPRTNIVHRPERADEALRPAKNERRRQILRRQAEIGQWRRLDGLLVCQPRRARIEENEGCPAQHALNLAGRQPSVLSQIQRALRTLALS